MRAAGLILLNALLVAVGLFVYDALRAKPAPPLGDDVVPAPVLRIAAPTRIDGEEGERLVFDEETLAAIEAYVEEVERRNRVQRVRRRVERELRRLDLQLTDEVRGAVVDATLAFQARGREVFSRMGSPDADGADGREARRAALEALRAKYAQALRDLIPEADAEVILKSRLERTLGLYPAGSGPR